MTFIIKFKQKTVLNRNKQDNINKKTKTAAPYFQRVIPSEVLAGYVQNICELYLDDVITYGNTVEERGT